MKSRFFLLGRVLLVGLLCCQSAGAVEQVVLIQNSGWMDPFYNDPASRLKPLIGALVRQTSTPEDAIHVASFNERTPDSPSPELLYTGRANGFSDALLKDLKIGTKTSGAWADTNMIEAITVAVRDYLQNRSGVIWLLTNNRNSPGNDQRTAERNREFYALLHESPYISRTIAFPVRMPLRGTRYESSGLMVYALAYGEAAGIALKQMVDAGSPQALRFIRPARLKPLDQDSVVIEPKQIEPPEVDVRTGPDGLSFVFDLDAASRPDVITLHADVRNLFFPYRIDSARLEYAFTDDKGLPLQIRSEPDVLTDIGPGERARVSFSVQVPVESIPSRWSVQAFTALGDTIQIPATLRVRLAEQRLSIDPSFTQGIGELFPDDPISEVFEPSALNDSSTQTLGLVFRIQYPLLPLLTVLGLMLAGLSALLYLAQSLRSPRTYSLNVDGENRRVQLAANGRAVLRDAYGEAIGEVRRPLIGKLVINPAEGHQIHFNS